MLDRRRFIGTSLSAAAAAAAVPSPVGAIASPSGEREPDPSPDAIREWAADAPLKLAHREGNMLDEPSPYVYELASQIPGLGGIEVQTVRANLWDHETALAYRKASHKWGVRTVSMGGTLPPGERMSDPGPAEISYRKTMRAGEILGAGVILVFGARENGPDMDDESNYGPVVEMLQRLAPDAQDMGMDLGLELSLDVAEYQMLLDLVDHPAVRPYWDATGTDHMGNPGEGMKGIEVFGSRICQMHLKNGRELMETEHLMREHPRHPEAGRARSIPWREALPLIKASGFDGWMAFETPHESPEDCIEDTKRNIAFITRHWV